MNEGKYYQAGLLLKSAQDGIVVDSQSVQESPTHSVQHDAAHYPQPAVYITAGSIMSGQLLPVCSLLSALFLNFIREV